MKKVIYSLVIGACCLVGCENKLLTPVVFDVTVAAHDSVEVDTEGVYHAPVGTSVRFLIDGNADFISLSYSIFNETDAKLTLDSKVSWADNDDNLHLYMSTDFPGLSGDVEKDVQLLRSHAWTEVGKDMSWPKAKNEQVSDTLDISRYKGEKVVFAYQYVTRSNEGFQPMFTISNMQVTNTVRKTGEIASVTPARTMGWKVMDVLKSDSASAYMSGTVAGVWDISFSDDADKTAIKIRQTAKGRELNEDWLISQPVQIPRGKEEGATGISVKNIYLGVTEHPFTFSEYGEYTLTFYAANANYLHESNTQKSYKFIIHE